MGGKIPQNVRLEVISRWLRGYSRDGIARECEIGTGTVSNVVQQVRQDDAKFDLLRGVAVELKARGLRVEDFAPLLRLKSLLQDKEVELDISNDDNLFSEYKKFEAIIITLEVLCFKHEMTTDLFFNVVFALYSQLDKHDISIEKLPEYIENQANEISRIQSEIRYEVEQRGATMDLLREYEAEKSSYKVAFDALPTVKKERDDCRRDLALVRKQYQDKVWEQKNDEFGWYVDPEEMNKTKIELTSGQGKEHYASRLEKPGLKNILFDLYRYPSKYIESIRKIIDSYDSLHGVDT